VSKITTLLACFAFITISAFIFTSDAKADERNIQIRIDGEVLHIPAHEQHPIMQNGHVLVPARAVMEALHAGIWWDENDRSVGLSALHAEANIQIGHPYMYIEFHGEPVYLDVPPQIINGRTMVDIGTIRNVIHFDYHVEWDVESSIVIIESFRFRMPEIIQRPVIRPEYWPEHLPYHVPGSINLRSEFAFEGLIPEHQFPQQFRAVFYRMSASFLDLVTSEQRTAYDRYIWSDPAVVAGETMALMRFVQVHNISREDFDAVMEQMTANLANAVVILGLDPNDEWEELPNADIIFTFDDEIIRWFYRRE